MADDDDRIIRAYNERLDTHGYDPRTLGWPKGRQRLRFDILASQWECAGKRVLDFGCGFGDLYGYFVERGIEVDYHGVDINERLIEQGRERHPAARLEVANVVETGLSETYDLVFSSGVHNIRRKDADEFTARTFELFARHSAIGFASNFLSDRVDKALEHAHHSSPVRVLELGYRHSRRLVLRNDYMPFEFTLFVDMRDDFDPASVVYPQFLGHVQEPRDGG